MILMMTEQWDMHTHTTTHTETTLVGTRQSPVASTNAPQSVSKLIAMNTEELKQCTGEIKLHNNNNNTLPIQSLQIFCCACQCPAPPSHTGNTNFAIDGLKGRRGQRKQVTMTTAPPLPNYHPTRSCPFHVHVMCDHTSAPQPIPY